MSSGNETYGAKFRETFIKSDVYDENEPFLKACAEPVIIRTTCTRQAVIETRRPRRAKYEVRRSSKKRKRGWRR